jgi:hypothetical protein
MASHSYCPNGDSKYANDNIYQLTSRPSQYLVPIPKTELVIDRIANA